MLRKLIKYYFPFILAQTFVLICAAQNDLPAESSGNIQFYLDDATFYNNDKIYHELYVMIFTDNLKLTSKNNTNFADLSLSLNIKKSNGEIKYDEQWQTEAEILIDTSKFGSKVIYDQWSRVFEPGVYKLELEVRDNIGGNVGTVRKEIEITAPAQQNLYLSEIQFASDIVRDAEEQNIFNKGVLTVIPNPSRRYGILNPLLYFYFEIYNKKIEQTKNITVSYEIESIDGTSLRSFNEKTINITGAASGVPNGFNVSAIASGIYYLVIKVVDSAEQLTIQERRPFEVIQMDYLEKSPMLTEEQAEVFGEMVKAISTQKNYELYQNLNLASKAKFLVQFWKQNDPDPTTDENEVFDRLMQRYQYANEHFSWGKLEGWKTDRGKVLLKNGMPDNIQRYHSEESTFPYEIWEYQERRNYIYVFGDLRNDGRYSLLHSNKEGEVYNPYWKDELNRM